MLNDITDVVDLYRVNAILHREESAVGNSRKANRAHDKIISAYRALNQTVDGRKAILALLEDPDPGVKTWAATHSLEYAECEALAQLDLIASGVGPTAHSAGMVAKLWRTGELKLAR